MNSLKKLFKKIERSILLGDIQSVKEILKTTDARDYLDRFLLTAIESNRVKIAKIFLENGPKINYLHEAIYTKNIKLVQLLLDYKPDINACDEYGNTPLLMATFQGKEQIALCLIEAGADIAQQDCLGFMPVHGAVINNLEEVITIFIKRGINCDIKNLKPSLSVSLEEIYSVAFIANNISDLHKILLTFFALNEKNQLECLPILDSEYLFDFPDGNLLTDKSLWFLENEYMILLTQIHYHLFDNLSFKLEVVLDKIYNIINYATFSQ